MILTMNKETRLNLRITEMLREDIEALAAYHGLSMSSYAHSLLVKSVRREKDEQPEAFATQSPQRHLAPVVAHIGSPRAEELSREQIQRTITTDELAEAKRRTTPRKTMNVPTLKQNAK